MIENREAHKLPTEIPYPGHSLVKKDNYPLVMTNIAMENHHFIAR